MGVKQLNHRMLTIIFIFFGFSVLAEVGGLECWTLHGKQCIFPFQYRGETYHSCTTTNSKNYKAWCATEINYSGEVINQKWGDCEPDCTLLTKIGPPPPPPPPPPASPPPPPPSTTSRTSSTLQDGNDINIGLVSG